MIIGVLGPTGTYADKAIHVWLKHTAISKKNVNLHYYQDIIDTVNSVVLNSTDIGIVPIENSIEGSVGITLDLLLDLDIEIIYEVIVPIKHNLLSKGNKDQIKIILSHPQALGQCRHFIKTHFSQAEIRSTGSTSHAAKLATEFEEMAAIASIESAHTYGLHILCSNIQDYKNNHTRFIVFRKKSDIAYGYTKKANTYKTSVVVYLNKDRPGALYKLLSFFALHNINLTRIESRPSKKALGDYVFYIDFIGNISDKIIKDVLNNIASKAGMMKVLGSYLVIGYSGIR